MYLSLLGIDIDVVEIDALKYWRYCGNGCPAAGKGRTLLNISILTLERQEWKKIALLKFYLPDDHHGKYLFTTLFRTSRKATKNF